MKLISRAAALSIAATALFTLAGTARADDSQLRITEWMYKSADIPSDGKGEFIELTNIGTTSMDLTGWSQDDSTGHPGAHSMSSFGVIAAGESVVLTESDPDAFRATWHLDASVKVISYGGNDNLGSSDTINIYNASNQVVDSLVYGNLGPKTSGVSGRPDSLASLGAPGSGPALWVKSTVGDADHAVMATDGSIGSPGYTSLVSAVPEPSGIALALAGLGMLAFSARRKKNG
jgi:predicted extracellular nuclease